MRCAHGRPQGHHGPLGEMGTGSYGKENPPARETLAQGRPSGDFPFMLKYAEAWEVLQTKSILLHTGTGQPPSRNLQGAPWTQSGNHERKELQKHAQAKGDSDGLVEGSTSIWGG